MFKLNMFKPNFMSSIINSEFILAHHSLNSPFLARRSYSSSLAISFFSLESIHIHTAYKYLNSFHDFGLPWWISIFSATVSLRTLITLPLYVVSARNAAKLDNLRTKNIPLISKELQEEVKLAMVKFKWDENMARSHFHINMKRLVSDLYVKNNCHPLKELILPLIQIPVWFSLSIALRQMTSNDNIQLVLNGTIDSLSKEGIFWFPNLLLPDHYILPTIMCVTNLLIFEMYNMKLVKNSRIQKFGVIISRGLIMLMFPISAMLPTCISYYWTCSSLFGLAQNILLRMPLVRRKLKIPASSLDNSHFFQDFYKYLKNKLKIR